PQSGEVEAVLAGIVRDYPDLQRFDVYAVGTAAQLQLARELFLKQGVQQQYWREYACQAG
ncbi:MAG: hypothetical protein WCB93_00045, partial [Gallionella sp.]